MKRRRSRTPSTRSRSRSRGAPARGSARRAADPYLAREAERYAAPLPSREFILQTLEAEAVPVDERHLAQLLGVGRSEREAFARRLAAMEREGQILRCPWHEWEYDIATGESLFDPSVKVVTSGKSSRSASALRTSARLVPTT